VLKPSPIFAGRACTLLDCRHKESSLASAKVFIFHSSGFHGAGFFHTSGTSWDSKEVQDLIGGKAKAYVAGIVIVAAGPDMFAATDRSEEHTSELQSRFDLVCRLLLEKKK